MILPYKKLFENILSIGDMAICVGDIDGLKTHNHIGIIKKEGVEFINNFSDRLHNMNGSLSTKNGWYILDKSWLLPFNENKKDNNIPLFYSDKFRNIISYSLKFLLDYEKIFYCDVSYIDTSWKNDMITFLSAKDFQKLEPNEDPWTSTMRQELRIGRFLMKIVNDTARLIEDYSNEYKFSFKINSENFSRFKIAKGIDMAKWYLEKNYAEGGGTLRASCMRHARSQMRLPIYINHPDKIKMLYLLDTKGKLLARSLIWKLDHPRGMLFMDRIYFVDDYLEKLFLDYAHKKNIITKNIVDKEGLLMKIYLNEDYGPPQKNPFMDTFKFFDRNEMYLTNKFNNLKVGEYWEYIDHD